jgi:polygalacturonase
MNNRREFLKNFLLGGTALVIAPGLLKDAAHAEILMASAQTSADAWAQVPRILARIKPPKFPKRDFSISKYGAVADGKTLSTEAFRKAIEAANKSGAGASSFQRANF